MFTITITYWMRETQCIKTDTLDILATLDTRQVQKVSIESNRGD